VPSGQQHHVGPVAGDIYLYEQLVYREYRQGLKTSADKG
jgi:hypothetical protein